MEMATEDDRDGERDRAPSCRLPGPRRGPGGRHAQPLSAETSHRAAPTAEPRGMEGSVEPESEEEIIAGIVCVSVFVFVLASVVIFVCGRVFVSDLVFVFVSAVVFVVVLRRPLQGPWAAKVSENLVHRMGGRRERAKPNKYRRRSALRNHVLPPLRRLRPATDYKKGFVRHRTKNSLRPRWLGTMRMMTMKMAGFTCFSMPSSSNAYRRVAAAGPFPLLRLALRLRLPALRSPASSWSCCSEPGRSPSASSVRSSSVGAHSSPPLWE